MARPPKKNEKDKKEKVIAFRVTQDEYDSIIGKAKDSAISTSEYCYRASMKKKIPQRPIINRIEPSLELLLGLRELKKIGSNINQLAKLANTHLDMSPKVVKDAIQSITDLISRIDK